MKKHDVVYILRANCPADELRFSLRSIEANMTHGKVWFYCGKPEGIEPDEYVPQIQTGGTKWERVRSSLIKLCENEEISEKFWLFNDDFYVMQRIESTKPMHRGLLMDHIAHIEARHRGPTAYSRMLKMCEDQLRQAGLTTLDYALHVPILIDRKKMRETLEMFPRCPMFRSLYGNYAKIGGEFHKDVKTNNPGATIDPEADFFSTSNKGFGGEVRAALEAAFPDPCRYEVNYGADMGS